MFFGNNKGIIEFDGTRWKTYPMPNRTIVRAIAAGKDGSILIGAQDEFGYLSPEDNGVLKYHSLIHLVPEEQRSFEDIWHIIPTDDGVFFYSKSAIFIWNGESLNTIIPDEVFENAFSVDGEVYVQESGKGLLKWENGRLNLVIQESTFLRTRIVGMFSVNGRTMLITEKEGAFLQGESGFQKLDSEFSSFIKNNIAYCATKLSNGQIAIGTVLKGLIVLDTDLKPVMHLSKSSGLQNNSILAIFEDNQSNLWLGLDNGIDYIKVSQPFKRIGSNAGIEGTGYASIFYEDNLYLGTNQGILYIDLLKKNNPLEPNVPQLLQSPKGQVWALNKVGESLLIGMHEGAFALDNGIPYRLSNQQGAWKFMQLVGNDNYAVEGNYNGLNLYEKLPSGKWQFKKKLEGFNESARVMEQQKDGSIWVSHAYKGLYRIRLSNKNDSIEKVDFYTVKDGLPNNISLNVTKVKDEVVFTTSTGVYSFDEKINRFVTHDKFNEFLGGEFNIHRIIEDQMGNIWYSLDDDFGVIQLSEKGFLEEVNYNRFQFNHLQEELVDGFESIYALDEKNIFIATENGFVHFDPSADNRQKLKVEALIKEVVLMSKKDSIIYSESFKNEINEDQLSVDIPYSMRSIRISYAAPFYENIGLIKYRYKLDGFDEEWSSWSKQAVKEFTNLPYGNYQFILEAQNAYGQVSSPTILKVNILPPWYASLFAKIIYTLFGVIFLFSFYRYSQRRLELEKQAIFKEQTQKLEKKEAIFKEEKEQSDAEIIRLRNENLTADIKHKNSQLASATMHLVQKGEILLKIKNELTKLNLQESANKKKVQQLARMIDEDIRLDNNWDQFETHFDQVHENFLKNLRDAYPKLTPKDQKLCAYLRMNLTTKEIAPLMNISVRGVEISRYRLRKKLSLATDVNLVDFIMKF